MNKVNAITTRGHCDPKIDGITQQFPTDKFNMSGFNGGLDRLLVINRMECSARRTSPREIFNDGEGGIGLPFDFVESINTGAKTTVTAKHFSFCQMVDGCHVG